MSGLSNKIQEEDTQNCAFLTRDPVMMLMNWQIHMIMAILSFQSENEPPWFVESSTYYMQTNELLMMDNNYKMHIDEKSFFIAFEILWGFAIFLWGTFFSF